MQDPKVMKLMHEWGILGYGVYFAIVEMIARRLTQENIKFDLEHDLELLSKMFSGDKFKLKHETLHEIISYITDNKVGLMNFNLDKRLECIKLLKRLDISTSSNLEIKKVIHESKKKGLI